MKLPDFRLSTRITAGTIAIVVAGAAALVFIENARLHDVYLSEQRARLEHSLHDEKLRLDQTINTLREDVLFLSNIPPVPGIVRAALNRGYDARDGNTREMWEARLQQIFSAFSAVRPDYYQIRYIGVADGGRELVRIDNRAGKIEITPPARLQAKGDRDYFKAVLGLRAGEVYFSEFNLNREWGVIEQPYRPTLRAATPVFTPSGQIFGMVVVNLDVSRLLASAASGLPAGVQAYLTNMGGEYLLHPDMRRSFGFELGGKDKITTDFPLLETIFNPRASEHFSLQAIAAKAAPQYLAAERIHFDPGNPARFLLLAYHLPAAAAEQQIATISARHIAGGFIAMLLVSGIALLVLRRTFAPLEQLTAAADKIAAGNNDVLLPQNGSGEIRHLANAFGAMLAKLSQREQDILLANEGLEKRVKERTIELELAQQKTEKLLHELSTHEIEIEMQNDELRQAQVAMEESRDRYVDLYDFAPIGYLTLTRDALISEINLTGARLLGTERDKLIHSRFARLVASEDSDRWHRHFMGILQHGDQQSCELALRRGDGSRFHAQLDCLRLINDGNAPVVRITLTDVTERNQAQSVLQRHHLVIETALDGFWMTSAEGVLQEVNEAYAKMSGYTAQELVGMHISQLEVNEQTADVRAHIAKIIAQGHDRFETRHRRKDGHEMDVEVSVTYLAESRQLFAFCRDTTARKQVEEARFRESEERFRGTLEQVAVGIAHTTLDGHFQQVNQKFCKIVGYARDELMQMSFYDVTFPADMEEQDRRFQQLLAGEISTFSMEKRYVRKDRSLVWANLTVSLLRDADGTPRYTIGVIEDITERRQAEALVQQFGHLLQNSFDEIYIFDAHTLHFLLTSEGAEKNLGYSSDELNQLTPLDLCPSFTRESFGQMIASLRSGEQPSLFFETVLRRRNGTTYPVEMRLQFMESDFPVFMAVVQDVTERNRSERQLRDLSAHLQTAREEEKASVAREIHDNLGSTLTALKMDAYWLAEELSANKDAALLIEHVESMSQLLDNAVDVTRRVITDLRPTILDDLGLQAALEWQAGQFHKRTGIQCLVTACTCIECRKDELDKTQTINLFRIFQESLTNVARHSGASRVEVELQCEDGEVILAISDNGCGLPEGHSITRTSYGMLGMRERAGQLGGRVNFYSPPGGGFSVTVILPLPTDNQKEGET